jgi:hypothetical protein
VIIKNIEGPSIENARAVIKTGLVSSDKSGFNSIQTENLSLPPFTNSSFQPAAPETVSSCHLSTPSQNFYESARIRPLANGTISGGKEEIQNSSSCQMTGALVPTKKTDKKSIYHDYGDGAREIYELDSSDNDSPEESELKTANYHPLPPFNPDDLRELKKRNIRRRRASSNGS